MTTAIWTRKHLYFVLEELKALIIMFMLMLRCFWVFLVSFFCHTHLCLGRISAELCSVLHLISVRLHKFLWQDYSIILYFYRSLNSNNFSGSIPPSIGNLSNLSWLDLSENNFNGTIPVSSGTTPGLDMLLNAKHLYVLSPQKIDILHL